MVKSDEASASAVEVPPFSFVLRFYYSRKPVVDCKVWLVSKGLSPLIWEKTTDQGGGVIYSAEEILASIIPQPPPYPENVLLGVEDMEFLLIAGKEDVGYIKDVLKFKLNKVYDFSMKKYTEAPRLFIKFDLKDVIGAELFSSLVGQIEAWILGQSGFEIVGIEGSGTKSVTVVFKPPFISHSPISIGWMAIPPFIKGLILLVISVIVLIIVLRWSFGEYGGVAFGLGFLFLFLILALSGRRKEQYE